MSLPSRSPSCVRCPIFRTRTKIRPERRHRCLRIRAATTSRRSHTRTSRPSSVTSSCYLIDAIAGAPKSEQPSKEDIESIVKEVTQIEAHRKGCIAASYLTHALGTSSKSSKSACSQANQLVVKQVTFKVSLQSSKSNQSQKIRTLVNEKSTKINSKSDLSQWKVNKKVIDYQDDDGGQFNNNAIAATATHCPHRSPCSTHHFACMVHPNSPVPTCPLGSRKDSDKFSGFVAGFGRGQWVGSGASSTGALLFPDGDASVDLQSHSSLGPGEVAY
ncbi:hypothetical protein EDB85DRAFT_1885512 [Lactarius pseudohatsudake]|nr:hypothetical protein EDB85DRAFT_1885512 [Lactarius pseudohatsudake]